MEKEYKRIMIINLLTQTRSTEEILIKEFEKCVKENTDKNNITNIKYEYFDLNYICKNGNYENLNIYIDKLADAIKCLSFYVENVKEKQVIQ